MSIKSPDDYPTRTSLYLPASLHHRVRVLAAQRGTTMTQILVDALTAWLATQADAPAPDPTE